MNDPTDLNGEEELLTERSEILRIQAQAINDDYVFIMSTAQGRRFMWNLLSLTRYSESAYSSDQSVTNFRLGEQNIGLRIVAKLHEVCLGSFRLMEKERDEYCRSRNKS